MGLTIDTRVAKKFKHRLSVCRQEDVVLENDLLYRKHEIYTGWAMVERRRAQTFSPDGQSVLEEHNRRTHFIRMRYRPDVEITMAAWLYEHRMKSAPRWFKVLNVGDEYEDSRYFLFECRLMEQGDQTIKPIITSDLTTDYSNPQVDI